MAKKGLWANIHAKKETHRGRQRREDEGEGRQRRTNLKGYEEFRQEKEEVTSSPYGESPRFLFLPAILAAFGRLFYAPLNVHCTLWYTFQQVMNRIGF